MRMGVREIKQLKDCALHIKEGAVERNLVESSSENLLSAANVAFLK